VIGTFFAKKKRGIEMSEPNGDSSIVLSNAGELIRDLWDFIENVTDADPARTDKLFALRERVRNHYADFERFKPSGVKRTKKRED
jgi:hypothetical protein